MQLQAEGSDDLHDRGEFRVAIWAKLVEALEQIAPEQRSSQVLMGFLAEIWECDRDLAQHLLDSVLDQPALLVFLPALHSAVGLDDRGVARMKRTLSAGQVTVSEYRYLAFGGVTDLAGAPLKDLLLLIADQPDGLDVALEILQGRLLSDGSAHREHEPKLLETGRELLARIKFRKGNQETGYRLAEVVKSCLVGPDAAPIAAKIAVRLRQAVASHETSQFGNVDLLQALLARSPAGGRLGRAVRRWREGPAGGYRRPQPAMS